MSSIPNRCANAELTCAYALGALAETEASAARAHIAECPECLGELDQLAPGVERLVHWPTDVLRPSPTLQGRLAQRIAKARGGVPTAFPAPRWPEPEWDEVAPGIECKLLATDTLRDRVSMMVRMAPGARYPAHTHAGDEELFLLDGELWIDERKLSAGDYNFGAPGATDERVWTETGCTCLLITSSNDALQ